MLMHILDVFLMAATLYSIAKVLGKTSTKAFFLNSFRCTFILLYERAGLISTWI